MPHILRHIWIRSVWTWRRRDLVEWPPPHTFIYMLHISHVPFSTSYMHKSCPTSHMNESRQIWMKLKLYISPYGSSLSFVSSLSHIKSEWAVSHIPYASNKVIYPTLAQGYAQYESCRIRVMPHILHPICISHIPHPIWMSHVKYEWSPSNIIPYDLILRSHMHKSYPASHMNESRQAWMKPKQYIPVWFLLDDSSPRSHMHKSHPTFYTHGSFPARQHKCMFNNPQFNECFLFSDFPSRSTLPISFPPPPLFLLVTKNRFTWSPWPAKKIRE